MSQSLLNAPCHCHKHTYKCTYAQTKRQQRRKWGWVIVMEQMWFKFGLSVTYFVWIYPCYYHKYLHGLGCLYPAKCTCFCRCKIVYAQWEMGVVMCTHMPVSVCVFALCAYLYQCRQALKCVCVCDKLPKNSKQSPYAIMADAFDKAGVLHAPRVCWTVTKSFLYACSCACGLLLLWVKAVSCSCSRYPWCVQWISGLASAYPCKHYID